MSSNIFTYNAAVYGGSIYCNNCNLVTMANNQFSYDYAAYGGDIYLLNLANNMVTSPPKLTYHQHTYSTANVAGGSIYYQE